MGLISSFKDRAADAAWIRHHAVTGLPRGVLGKGGAVHTTGHAVGAARAPARGRLGSVEIENETVDNLAAKNVRHNEW